MKQWRKLILVVVGLAVAGIVLLTIGALILQNNPPVVKEPAWDSQQTRALEQRACFDCHSNETIWPWYDKLPGGSWLAVLDMERGRRKLNFSEWSSADARRATEAAQQIQWGKMPPRLYTMMHANAVLSAQEQQQLIDGLKASLK